MGKVAPEAENFHQTIKTNGSITDLNVQRSENQRPDMDLENRPQSSKASRNLTQIPRSRWQHVQRNQGYEKKQLPQRHLSHPLRTVSATVHWRIV
jgi:hypothetical protein